MSDPTCNRCLLSSVFIPGEGPVRPRLIVVADWPRTTEEKLRRPLVGQAGNMLRGALERVVGLDLERDVYFTTMIKCPPREKKVGPREIYVCKTSWYDPELKRLRDGTEKTTTQIILIAGETPRSILLPSVKGGMGKNHGSVIHDPIVNVKYLLTFDPDYVDRFSARTESGARLAPRGSVVGFFLDDMRRLKKLLETGE